MNVISFQSQIQEVGTFCADWRLGTIKTEPQFFSCNIQFAYDNGGHITTEFIECLPDEWLESNCIVDSRVHMLMPGWYPCIPGWHLDDVPRTREDGQPDHLNPKYKSEHLLGIVGDCSKTEFAVGSCQLEEPAIGKVVYGEWHSDIEEVLSRENSPLQRISAEPGIMYQFDWQTWHRGTSATHSGWRWFIRLSRNTERKIVNEIRTQTQVYLPCVDMGW